VNLKPDNAGARSHCVAAKALRAFTKRFPVWFKTELKL